ncbi:hypothetical protein FI667_g1017, partial [Globisporangium splendens]
MTGKPPLSLNLSTPTVGSAPMGLPPAAPVRFPEGSGEVVVKRNQSKYDFVKVRVWVSDHFYVLSRYLVCRALVSTKINSKDAVQISLDLKRTLVDLGLTDIVQMFFSAQHHQEQFEDFLYKTMLVFGYGETHISCYRMMSSVLQTDLIFELMCNFSGRKETLYFSEEFPSKEALIEEYKNDCDVVRKGVTSDIDKCLKEGKSLIVEGFHIDPRLYQKEVAVQVHNSSSAGGGKGGFSGIVVPFLLTLDEKSHWDFMTNSPDPRYRTQEAHQFGFSNLQSVQTYLVDHEKEEGVIPFKEICINLNSFHERLDLMHDIVLKRIEEEYVVNNK